MRTFNTQITKQIAFGQRQGRIAVATKCLGTVAAAQHLESEHPARHSSRLVLSQLWHGLRTALVGRIQNAWQNSAQILDLVASAGAKQLTKSTCLGMSGIGILFDAGRGPVVPVAVRRLRGGRRHRHAVACECGLLSALGLQLTSPGTKAPGESRTGQPRQVVASGRVFSLPATCNEKPWSASLLPCLVPAVARFFARRPSQCLGELPAKGEMI